MRFRAEVTKVWHGVQLLGRMLGAAARSTVSMADDHVVPEAKARVRSYFAGSPDSTGRLERSIHSAPVNYDPSSDYDDAEFSDLDNMDVNDLIEDSVMNQNGHFVLIAGSWLPYACVVESGRKMPYMNPAMETLAGTRADEIVYGAFREAGLGGV